MKSPVLTIAVLLAASLLCACNRNSPPARQQSPAAAAPAPAPPAAPVAPQPPPTPPGTEVPVASINSVMLNRPQDSPGALIVDVSGTTPTPGWTNPRLTEDTEASGDPSVKTYKFVATSPQNEEQDHTQQTLDAELRIDALPPEVKSIRVTSASNEISAPVTE